MSDAPATLQLIRRVAAKTGRTASASNVAAKTLTVSGKMVLQTAKIKAFRGFTQTPEEGQKLARTSFADTPLLKRAKP